VVLIVDDHEDSSEMYSCGLLAMGFQPVTAETADDAFARTCELHPDVIVAGITRSRQHLGRAPSLRSGMRPLRSEAVSSRRARL